ncbi:MAG: hypothetical protein J7K23_08225 [Thermoproteales archaeon]|nr:hypothetical protein [Thermoproteales archaeon]
MIRKAIIPAAGLGTRLLPTTKELPKEMLPVYVKADHEISLKPTLQIIFEELYEQGIREFCFIVGRGKRAIEDHFTPDNSFLQELYGRKKDKKARMLEEFYNKIKLSRIVWINQPEPKGFGDAVRLAEPFIGNESFIVHAGDTIIFSQDRKYFKQLIDVFEDNSLGAVFLVKEVENPRIYGVVEPSRIEDNMVSVKRIVEKPETPPSNLAVLPIYIFDPIILKALKIIEPGPRGEIELTDGIQKIIDWGFKVMAIKLDKDEERIDIGTPETYWEALKISYRFASGRDE